MTIGNLSKYEVLVTVAEAGSLTAAAERLGYTQSGVSRIIADLEAECGFPLLIRGKLGCSLTKEGEKMIVPIRGLLRAGEIVTQTAAEINGLRTGHIRVGLFSSAAVQWAPKMVTDFLAQYPNITVEFYAGLYQEIVQMVESEELDCGFITREAKEELHFTELKSDRLLAVLPLDHPLANAPAFPVGKLAEEDFILPGEGSHNDIGRIFSHCNLHPNVRFSMRDDSGAIAMAAHGLGISILPEMVLMGVSLPVRALPLDPPFSRVIGIASKPNRVLSPAARAFIAFTEEWIKKL